MNAWSRHLRIMLASFAGLLALAAVLIFIANPYGNLTGSPLRHVLMDDNQRFQYPAVIRSKRYDSIVIGTSTARLLEPARLEAGLGGRFANLALNSGTPWEQWRVARLMAATVGRPRTLVVGLDRVWCEIDADSRRITTRGFPEWMFDDNPWNDLAYMLNIRTIEIAGRRIGHALGLAKERWPHNGYEIFTPPESSYDAAKARRNIHGSNTLTGQRARRERPGPEVPPDGFPALAWLESLAGDTRFERVVLAFMPTHVATHPAAGSPAADRETNCKAKILEIARRHRRSVVDFRIRSSITERDENYWDALHYRVPVATRVVEGLAKALATGRDDPGGDWAVRHWAAGR